MTRPKSPPHDHRPKYQIEIATYYHGPRAKCLICNVAIEELHSDVWVSVASLRKPRSKC